MKIIATVLAMLWATSAQASCRYYTITVNGKTLYCSECCYGVAPYRTCNTTCN